MITAFFRAFKRFVDHRGFFLSAGLSFYLLVCLIPLLFLVVSSLGFVLSREGATQAVVDQVARTVPVYRETVDRLLPLLIAARKKSGVAGTLTLIFFCTQLFSALRYVMDQVFGVRQGKGWVRGTLQDLVMVAVMGALLLGSIGATMVFYWMKTFIFTPTHLPPAWIRGIFTVFSLAFNSVLFYVSYRYFPNRPVRPRNALAGAVLASVLWELARAGFRAYIVTYGFYDKVWGPLGALVGIAMFAYYSGAVTILGAEYAAALETKQS